MWKVLIADDEPKIRQGLKSTLENFDLPLTVCAEAKNGLEALEKTKELKPDILLVDICMPKLSGISFLEEIKKLKFDGRMIVISGFNEFSYAKQAIRLGVSFYLLKPIAEEELKDALEETIRELEKSHKSRKFMELMRQQIQQNRNYLRDIFFNDWVDGKLSDGEWQEQMEFLGISIPETLVLVLVSVQSGYEGKITNNVTEELYRMTLEKGLRDMIEEYSPIHVFMNRYQDVLAILGGYREEMEKFQYRLKEEMEKLTGGKCWVQIRSCLRREIAGEYEKMRIRAQKLMECRPIVAEAML